MERSAIRENTAVAPDCASLHPGYYRFLGFEFQHKADFAKHTFAISRRASSEVCYQTSSPSSRRAQGKPGARCTRGLVCKMHKQNAHEHTGSAEASDFPCAVVYGLYVLSPAIRICLSPSSALAGANLTPTMRRQDHTILPSALASPVSRAAASTAPRPASVTFAKRPSEWDGMRIDMPVIWGEREAEYF